MIGLLYLKKKLKKRRKLRGAGLPQWVQLFRIVMLSNLVGKSVTKTGNKEADNLLIGYVVAEAENFSDAEKLAEGAPSVASGQGSIEVYEIMPTLH